MDKSFLLLFFKKEALAYFPTHTQGPRQPVIVHLRARSA
jgi:hypothetical protein